MHTLTEVAHEYACHLWSEARYVEVRHVCCARLDAKPTLTSLPASLVSFLNGAHQAIQLWAEYVLPSAGVDYWNAFVAQLEAVGRALSAVPFRDLPS